MVQAGLSLLTVKLIMILVILWLTSPTSTHAIAKAARMSGLDPVLDGDDA
jgi:multicomponent Na+:H+ antiporter subunit G